MSNWDKKRYVPKEGGSFLPPQLNDFTNKSTDEIVKELNKLPFFMTSLNEENSEDNMQLEALKALVYDGEPEEIATNFKNQGNDCFKSKDYKNAVIYYSKGIAVLTNPENKTESNIVDLDILKVLYLNRSIANFNLKNYRRSINDSKEVLKIDIKNIKAYYRIGLAYLALDKFQEAKESVQFAEDLMRSDTLLKTKTNELSIKGLNEKIKQRQEYFNQIEKNRKLKELKEKFLLKATQIRNIKLLSSSDSYINNKASFDEYFKNSNLNLEYYLEDFKDIQSQLIFPVIVIHPIENKFDFVQAFGELSNASDLLKLLYNDDNERYFNNIKRKQIFLETDKGGLIKLGKNVEISQVLQQQEPKIPLFDKCLRVYIVDKSDISSWIKQWKENKEKNDSER
ncbi:HSP70/90 family co-chaperone CNS1 ASCRUDRAFT_76294 [Ascoidea rubescens DSM 1968]|uniref:Cns1/TTC4 wheel domain-containing protein n=1 Tax=Ascoidea rubescens DSM 1968 TaxID=1344418 RepID=A0A1D2VF10_9ASCO|nr:hypothetical protein ASCRUDRAFT_76294 [Ascoidea rubescens DSM 1968]ODV60278.1 hypothetical protein ASCRUDRAFT_76294 [Ascoidea rubescens DSM 1968]